MPPQDEPTPGTTDQDTRDDADTGAGASGSDAAGGSDSEHASESADEKLARLERTNQQLLSEKTNNEAEARRLKTLELDLEERRRSARPPTTDAQAQVNERLQRDLQLEEQM